MAPPKKVPPTERGGIFLGRKDVVHQRTAALQSSPPKGLVIIFEFLGLALASKERPRAPDGGGVGDGVFDPPKPNNAVCRGREGR